MLHGINNIRHREMHTAEPSEPEPKSFEVEIATEKIRGYK
jgi:hypothetical protein